jgi:hypothetical protein
LGIADELQVVNNVVQKLELEVIARICGLKKWHTPSSGGVTRPHLIAISSKKKGKIAEIYT